MKKVLVVDDVPEIRMVLRALLEEPDVDVLEAGDGCEALEVLDGADVNVVVTDCQMPNMTGVELMHVAKLRYPEVPFVMVSSTAGEEDLGDLEPYAMMSKPFPLAELKDVVSKALSEG
jgi:CheY-like chemotaxis protein